MSRKLLSTLLFAALLAAAACAPPPAAGAAALPLIQDAVSGRAARAGGAKSASLRPRLMGRALDMAVLAPSASIAALDEALYSPTPSPELRSLALMQLASLHLDAGRPEAALAAARAGYDLAERTGGRDDVQTIAGLTGLGEALQATGRLREAEAALTFAAVRGRLALGPDHPVTQEAERLRDRRAAPRSAPWLRNLSRKLSLAG